MYGELERSLLNPDDIRLLNDLLPKPYLVPNDEQCPDPFLQAIWAFAMVKAGVSADNFWPWATRMMNTIEHHPEGIFSDLAFQQLQSHLHDSDDKQLLQDLHSQYAERLDQGSFAIWDFAVAKGRESTEQWRGRLDLDAALPSLRPRKTLWARFRGWYTGAVSRLRLKPKSGEHVGVTNRT